MQQGRIYQVCLSRHLRIATSSHLAPPSLPSHPLQVHGYNGVLRYLHVHGYYNF